MIVKELLEQHLQDTCEEIHPSRLSALMDVALGLQNSKNLALSAMGRGLNGSIKDKYKIKKVDRLEGNKHLHNELSQLYSGLSSYIFTYVSHEQSAPIIVDLCYVKDKQDIQMLSAEIAIKGRSLPLYREIFRKYELKNRAIKYLAALKALIPDDKEIVVIMDAAFGEDWLKEIEALGWYWLVRIRQGKSFKLSSSDDWTNAKDFFPMIGQRSKCYENASIMKRHNRSCRLVTTRKSEAKKKRKIHSKYDKACGGAYRRSANEPWILATNLPKEYKTSDVIKYYQKRMQIEESFRDIKSHQFGLSGRYIRTSCIDRWGVKMLLAAIVQVMCWLIGVIGHSQNFQAIFQANTVKDRKVFSYFYLGQLIVQSDRLKQLVIDKSKLPQIIEQELRRAW